MTLGGLDKLTEYMGVELLVVVVLVVLVVVGLYWWKVKPMHDKVAAVCKAKYAVTTPGCTGVPKGTYADDSKMADLCKYCTDNKLTGSSTSEPFGMPTPHVLNSDLNSTRGMWQVQTQPDTALLARLHQQSVANEQARQAQAQATAQQAAGVAMPPGFTGF